MINSQQEKPRVERKNNLRLIVAPSGASVCCFFPNGFPTLNLVAFPIGDMGSPFSEMEGSPRFPLFLNVSMVFLKPPPNRPTVFESRRGRISPDSSEDSSAAAGMDSTEA